MNSNSYGVCRLSIVPVRADASHKSEQVTQLLFGDHYEVQESDDKDWVRIKVFADQYDGWIDTAQHYPVSPEFFDYINQAELKVTTDVTSTLLFNKVPVTLVMGSMIPISGSELFKMEEQFAFNGESKTVGLKRDFEFLKVIAQKYLNTPYLWGGKTPFGIDCSGFTQMVFRICGYQLQRDAFQQARQGREVESINTAKGGDLVFFVNSEKRIHHVGIYLGNGKIIHASGRVRVDKLTEDGIFQADTNRKTHALSHLRRVLSENQ
jgi:gamma-D-glutamyl-L-lysine dipeptidyl-peptidase